MSHSVTARAARVAVVSLLANLSIAAAQCATPQADGATRSPVEHIEPYHARFGRQRPVIAVVGVNSGTELTDYVIPYGILRQAAIGEVIAVATGAGPMTMRPALHIQPQASVADFDARFPEGADYVVVPAIVKRDDPTLLGWIRAQAAKGSTLVSICDGALVLADSGLLDGHRATAHWATAGYRRKTYPHVRWLDDRRYVADGRFVSSAGISAAIPTSLALIEAIGGRERASAVAAEIGAPDWGPAHDSQRFHPKLGRNLLAFATTQYLNGWVHRPQTVTLRIDAGVDEVAAALAADAFSRTGRAHVLALGARPIATLHGLVLLPDRTASLSSDRIVAIPDGKPARALDRALADIARRYGTQTAYGVALDFEYPGFRG